LKIKYLEAQPCFKLIFLTEPLLGVFPLVVMTPPLLLEKNLAALDNFFRIFYLHRIQGPFYSIPDSED
jgi:hypothetical protein